MQLQKNRKRIYQWLERITGCDWHRLGAKSIAIVDRKQSDTAWFSYRCQLRTILSKCSIDVALDVGAHEGQTYFELRDCFAGEIHSFEPVSSTFEKIAALSTQDPFWHTHQLALGSENSTMNMQVSSESDFSSFLDRNDYCSEAFSDTKQNYYKEEVEVRRLDSLLPELLDDLDGKNIFLKTDTQGFDLEVFEGAKGILKHIVAIQTELSLIPIYSGMPHWTQSIEHYEKAGFSVFAMYPIVKDQGKVIEYDCLLIRNDQ